MSRLTLAAALLAAAIARAESAKAVAPFPTEPQCVALGSPKAPYVFGPGEQLDFDVDAMGAKAGTLKMRTLPVRDGALPVEVDVETNTFFSNVRRVQGTATSSLSTRTLRPVRYYEDAHENEWHRVADVQFQKNHVAHLVSTVNGRSSEHDLHVGNDATDVVGAIYLMRQLPLKEGQAVCFDVYGIRRIWRVWGTVQPREHVSLPVGEFEAWHLAGEAGPTDDPGARRQIHLWVSDDARRLPLAALGTIDLGAVRATLTAFSRPGDAARKAENKGNLKW
jgi:hypothetical protein